MIDKDADDDRYELSPLTLLLMASMLTAVVVSVALKFIYSVDKNQTNTRFKKRTREEEEKLLAALPPEEQIEADAESSSGESEEEEKVPENEEHMPQLPIDQTTSKMTRKDVRKFEKKKEKQEKQEALQVLFTKSKYITN